MGEKMLYIGMISKNKNIELSKELNQNEMVQAINIKKEEDIPNAGIDILVIEDMVVELPMIQKMLQNVKYLIIQDHISELSFHLEKEINIITFGFNHKSSVTISSVTEENIILCIQRTIRTISNQLIQPQEIIIKNTNKYNVNKYIIHKIIQEIIEK